MEKRAVELIKRLDLQPHREGGYFRRVFESTHRVLCRDSREERSALTTIYYLLTAEQYSRWHRIAGDEIWHHYEGDPVELVWAGADRCGQHILGPAGEASAPVAVVPGGCWQAARTLGKYALLGCSVAPGFTYAEFELLGSSGGPVREFKARYPDLWRRVQKWVDIADRTMTPGGT